MSDSARLIISGEDERKPPLIGASFYRLKKPKTLLVS